MQLDPSQINLQELGKSGYRLTPATLATRITGGQWVAAPHLMYISSIVASAIHKGGARITISVPPRHGKSEFCSIHTPIWALETYPQKNVILASYGAELSTDFSRRVRDTFVDEDLHRLLTTRLDPDSRQVGKFHTEDGGACFAMGLSGAITGRGAHLLLVDDYLKNAEESLSDSQREKVFETFRSTVFTRLEPGASIIVVATRWHVYDLIGKIHDEWPGMFTHIKLPALAEENDPLGREPGQALWPERYNEKQLTEIRDVLGSYWWQALYQQNPMASMSSVDLAGQLHIIPREDVPHPSKLHVVRGWDLSSNEGEGDWSVGFKLGLHKEQRKFYILEIRRFQKSGGATEQALKSTAEGDGPEVPIEIEQEPGSAGKNYIEYLKSQVLKGYSVSAERPTGPIEVRASPFLAAIEAGNVYMVEDVWNQPFIGEITTFPSGEHDDQIAAGSIAHKRLRKFLSSGVTWGRNQGGSLSTQPRQRKRKGYTTGVVW